MVRVGQARGARLPWGVWVVAGLMVAALMVVAGRYGFHRDEFYFVVTGEHPALAAPDNPMLVPYLAAGWYALVGGNVWAFRILPALAAGGYVVIGALIGREFSSSRAHQLGAAAATGLLAIVLATGHLFGTTVFDMLTTAAAVWMLIRALRADPQRWAPWIGVGVLTGVAMEIKVLAALVMVCCLAGVLILGPRRPLAGAKPWMAAVIAAVLAAPNLLWQGAHGWPQLVIADDIANGGSGSSTSRAALIPVTALEIGPMICLVLVIGVVRLLRRPWRDRYGWLAAGFLIFLALMLASGGKAYYPAAFYPALMAAGAGPVVDWVRRRPWRRILVGVLVAVSIIITASLTLPLFPAGSALFKVGMGPNPDMGETVGWDGYIGTVAAVAAAIPPGQQSQTIILASNYGEAGALYLARAGGTTPLPPVYSGNNAFWYWGPPPQTATNAVVVGDIPTAQLHHWYASGGAGQRGPPGHVTDEGPQRS